MAVRHLLAGIGVGVVALVSGCCHTHRSCAAPPGPACCTAGPAPAYGAPAPAYGTPAPAFGEPVPAPPPGAAVVPAPPPALR